MGQDVETGNWKAMKGISRVTNNENSADSKGIQKEGESEGGYASEFERRVVLVAHRASGFRRGVAETVKRAS